MVRSRAALVGWCVGIGASVAVPRAVVAQAWNDARTTELVQRATALRQRQLADSGLAQYHATAKGYLTFLAQLGEGFALPPKVVRADQLALEIFWRAPNYSKQWIVGRRDTLLLPTDIAYHRDHLGIVQNNFPEVIRLGDGDEVRDVPHPISATGRATYDFAITDSMRLDIPGRRIDVYEVRLRPRDDRVAAAVGAVYLAQDDAQIVRMAFSFTRAALRDKYLEDVSVVIENALIEGRFWLPRRQEIEIRRTGTWLDFPARGIIRGRWEICCYDVNQQFPAEVSIEGPEIVAAPAARRAAHTFSGTIMEGLPPEVRAVTDEDVRRVQADARALVRAGALARARGTTLAARSVGDMARVTRAEGLALGGGVKRRLGSGLALDLSGAYGFSDREPKGAIGLSWERGSGAALRLGLFRAYRDARDRPEASSIANSIAAQEFGIDYTEPIDVRGAEGRLTWGAPGGLRWSVAAAVERYDSVTVSFAPTSGAFEPTPPIERARVVRLALAAIRPAVEWHGAELSGGGELRAIRNSGATQGTYSTRLFLEADLARPLGRLRVTARSTLGAVLGEGGAVPLGEHFFAGGPLSAPGYASDRFIVRQLLTQRLELQSPVPFPSFSLGRWGRAPGRATLAPFAAALWTGGPSRVDGDTRGWYPSLGLGLLFPFDLVRVDVARGLRDGRWGLAIDIVRGFWPIL